MNSTFEKFKNLDWECDFRTHPAQAPLEGVLIETRNHPDLKYALKNFSCHFPWAALTVLGSDENVEFINKIIGPGTNIKISNFGLDPPFSIAKLNAILTRPEFWDQFQGDRVLFFMTDTGVRKNDVLRFLKYDWVGAPWHHFPVGDPKVFQGNGAFSIRNPKILRWVCERFTHGRFDEDVFFAGHIALSYPTPCLPTRETAIKFSTEGMEYPDVMGFHNSHTYLKESDVIWAGHEGPRRRRVEITRAMADDTDVTALIRIGIGAHCLRIGAGTLVRPGAKKLTIDGVSWDLDNGFVKDEILILPNETHREPHDRPDAV